MDNEFDRVTEILSPFSGVEFIPEEVLKPAGERGTIVHKYIEGILDGWECFLKEPELEGYIKSFTDFWARYEHAYEGGTRQLEQRFYCPKMKITGQADVIITLNNRTYLIDWKTSSRPHITWGLQGAAYKYLAEQNGHENVDAVLFVKLAKCGKKPTLYKYENQEELWQIFENCVKLYRYFDMKNTRNKWVKRNG
jgi:hypothetical protein